MTRKFTGWHMFAILVAFFATVVGVNLLMASFATSTFGGIQVENSYVASQKFNGWLEEAERSAALGWQASAERRADGRVRVLASGPGPEAVLSATARHTLGREADQALVFDRQADGSFVSREPLSMARWIVRLDVADGGARWRQEVRL
jgi:nitrogen fixation protein FixH